MSAAREGYRSFRAAPAVWTAVILSLALGTGANFTLFTLVNALILRPLPVADPGRLVSVRTAAGADLWNYAVFEQLRENTALFESVAAWSSETFDTAPSGRAATVNGLLVSGSFFSTLGLAPTRGRLLGAGDDRRPGEAPGDAVAVISDGFWRRHFNQAEDVFGQRLLLDRATFTIVGVMPRGFLGPEVGTEVDVAIPLGAEPLVHRQAFVTLHTISWLNVLARLRRDDARDAAIARLRAFQPVLRERILKDGESTSTDRLAEPLELRAAGRGVSALRNRYQRPLAVLGVVSALVLAIACANVANLLFARAIARRREMSVRLALGASTRTLVKSLMAESAILIGIGTGVGALVALWASRTFAAQVTFAGRATSLDLSPDWRVFGFGVAVASLTVCASALLPAWRAARVDPAEALSHGARVRSDGHRGVHALVIAQVAFTIVLLVAAGLFVRTLRTLVTQPLGLERNHVLVIRVEPTAPPADPVRVLDLYDRLRDAVRVLPGVEHASASTMTPVGAPQRWLIRYDVPSLPHISAIAETDRTIMANVISPGFFATFGTRVRLGREFLSRDDARGAPVAIVNQTFVDRVFDGASPIGQVVRQVGFVGRPSVDREIVGVVEDAAYLSLREMHLPTMYIPMRQRPSAPPVVHIGVRMSPGAPAALAETVLDALAAVDPSAALSAATLVEQVDGSLAQERLVAMLSAFFGGLALVLAAVGLYGVTSHTVGQRRAELGIRLALGATRGAVVTDVLRRVTVLVAAGTGIGLLSSWWLGPFVETLLYGLAPRDPYTLVGAAIAVATVGVAAGLVPAIAASRLDSAVVLRRE